MKGKRLYLLILACMLAASCFVTAAYADETVSVDWSNYSYDELVSLREELDSYIKGLERQYAIENGNRVITLTESEVSVYWYSYVPE